MSNLVEVMFGGDRPRAGLSQWLHQPWALLVVAGVVATVVATTPWTPDVIRDVAFILASCGSVIAGTAYLLRYRPGGMTQAGWGVLLFGLGGYAVADLMWLYYARTGQDPYPSPADVLFITATLVMIVGALLLVGVRRSRGDRLVSYDAFVVAGAVGLLLWVYVVEPSIVRTSAPTLDVVIGTLYPLLDIALAATVVRMVAAGVRTPRSILLLLAGLVMVTTADVFYYLQELSGTYAEWGWVDGSYMMSYVLISSALLHPSMAHIAEYQEVPPPLSRARLIMLSLAASTPIILLITRPVTGTETSAELLGWVAAVLFVVVIIRSWSLVGAVREVSRLQGNQRFAALVSHSADAIVVLDTDGRIDVSSDALTRVWSAPTDIPDPRFEHWIYPPDRRRFNQFLTELSTLTPTETLSIKVQMQQGDKLGHAEIVGANRKGTTDVDGLLLTIRDMTARVALESELRSMADRDDLTGLPNRKVFWQALVKRLEQAGRTRMVGVLFLDLDDFKNVNDGLGHVEGDAVLIEIARRLRAHTPSDGLAARLGGDEFAVVVAATEGIDGVQRLAERLMDQLHRPVTTHRGQIPISVSIGLSVANGQTVAQSLMRRADLAMYQAKRSGKGGIQRFSHDLGQRFDDAMELRHSLSTAVEEGQLRLVAQPIVEVETGRLSMAEVLVRWDHPRRGWLMPMEFIDLAEQSGLINQIGAWVLDEACRFAMSMPAPGWPVTVNVSAKQFGDDVLEEQVQHALGETGLDPNRLILEITESSMAAASSLPMLQRLRAKGVKVAVDDFGTGYSSLSLLQRFPVDIIKIDRSFLAEEPDTTADVSLSMTSGIVDLARLLNATTVAEGIESASQCTALAAVGCDHIQGFAISPPVELTAYIRRFSDPHEDHLAYLLPRGTNKVA